VIQDVDFTVSVLEELQFMGIHVSMDDFGTGYSQFSNVFPIGHVKIDQSFIRNLTTNPKNAAIIINHHSRTWAEFKVIAEGVETLEQLEFLHSKVMSCRATLQSTLKC